ncbi:MAG: hypothetical protein WA208_16455, partial [Thermoanaerobaculia bacterium]
VRIRAGAGDASQAPPVVASARDAAELLGISLDILGQPWARADHIYAEAFERLAGDISADLRWARRAAYGVIESPGAELLSRIADVPSSFRCDGGDSCLPALRRLAAVDESIHLTLIRGVSPLQRLSALAPVLTDDEVSEAVAAERIVATMDAGRTITLVENAEAVDAASWRVIEIASAAGHGVWITPRGATPLPRPRWFVIAPALAVRAAVEARVASVADPAAWLDDLVFSPRFLAYVREGDLPGGRVPAIEALGEPKRSFVGALALVGGRVPRDMAIGFLEHFLFSGELEELCVPGVVELQDGALTFASEDARREALSVIPAASRSAICRVAATLTEGVTSALLWHEAGEPGRATEILARAEWPSSQAAVEALSHVPRSLISPAVANRFAHALVDCGRYRDAKAAALLAGPEEREVVLALAERRSGDYLPAIDRLARMKERGFTSQLLYAELLRLTGRYEDAAVELALCRPATDDERVRHGYETAVLALDCGVQGCEGWMCEHYLAHRFATYRSLSQSRYGEAAAHALDAARCA